MINEDGFRPNVGIILCNQSNQLFWGHRIGHLDSWQFPQGGIQENETPIEAMFRELKEEIGLDPHQVRVIGQTQEWLKYRLPRKLIRRNQPNHCIGQKQRWFLLQLTDEKVNFAFDHTNQPEFDRWRWVEYWYPVNQVVHFKRQVYYSALTELANVLFGENPPPRPRLKRQPLNASPITSVPRPLYRVYSRY